MDLCACAYLRDRECVMGGGFVGGKKMYVGNACTLMMGVIFFDFVCINVINNNSNNVYDILIYYYYYYHHHHHHLRYLLYAGYLYLYS
jgi:hypothetical protein